MAVDSNKENSKESKVKGAIRDLYMKRFIASVYLTSQHKDGESFDRWPVSSPLVFHSLHWAPERVQYVYGMEYKG